ncbi:CATRA system-associated protein [Streptomyces sp. NPDC048643]|uniref:CATRA system-associated protein n=1 Tax=Streptomyces sp. NPDC048643 TaxID=3155637 RepID=UPI003413B416
MELRQILARLREIEDWSLTAEEWRAVGDVLNRLESVLPEGDDAETLHVLALLEPLDREGARRAQARLGAGRTPIPAQQREQRNHLVARLTADLSGPEDRSREGRNPQGETA